jgi:NADH-quinone oxidoreductase subunit N
MNAFAFSVLSFLPFELRQLFPEILLAAGILLACALEWSTDVPGKRLVVWFAAVSATASLFLVLVSGNSIVSPATGLSFSPDLLSQFARVVILTGTVFVLLAMNGSKALDGRAEQGEGAILVLSVALGGMLFASASHLMSLYLGLEFLSLSSYGLAGFRARDARASEAGLKYVLYGGVASAVALYGISHLWGMAGTFDLREIGIVLSLHADKTALIPLFLLGAAFAYKLGLVPFHFWSPDVYQGCPTVSAGFLSTIPKVAAFTALLKVLMALLPWWGMAASPHAVSVFLSLFATVSIVVGAVTAGVQKDAKRLLAFSSTANAGILLLAFASWITRDAVAALGFYLLAYVSANLGAFLALDILERSAGSTDLKALAGSWKRHPVAVVALAVCLFSLAGIPPLAGFAGKWAVLAEVVRASLEDQLGSLPMVGVVAALLGSVALAAAYLKVLRAAIVDDPSSPAPAPSAYRPGVLAEIPLFLCVVASVLIGLAWPLLSVFRSRLGG